jgi:hypothetical protein
MPSKNYDIEDTEESEYSDIKNIRYLVDNELLDFLCHPGTVIKIEHCGETYGAIQSPSRANIVRANLSRESGRLSFRLDAKGSRIDPNNAHTGDD